MRRYNYFDDDEENEEKMSISVIQVILMYIKGFLVAIFSGALLRRLRGLSGRRRILARLSAFLMLVGVVIVALLIFANSINNNNERLETFRKDAAAVCTDYIVKYGAIRWESLDQSQYGENHARLTGLCYARQMDFNKDGTDELMLCYYDNSAYTLEVWGYDKDGKFDRLYSHAASSTGKRTDGVWVGFYHRGGKYYICQSEPDDPTKVLLYALRGYEFRQVDECTYDPDSESYFVRGKINQSDFEIIRLSVFRKSKGDVLVDIVTGNIDSFGNISGTVLNNQKSSKQRMMDAYLEIIEKRLDRYGDPKIDKDDNGSYIDGVALVRLIDFDGDGTDELFLAFRKEKQYSKYDSYSGNTVTYYMPIYSMEVYNWNGSVCKRIFSKDSVSRELDNNQAFYVIFTKGNKKTDICNNIYSFENNYYYVATSKIYRLKKEKFDTIFSARLVNDYGYRSYSIDGETVYTSTFEQNGYRVPLFMNDEGTYSKDKFDIIYLSVRKKDTYQSTLDETVKTIQKFKKGYSPDKGGK